jgi:hypothetical protein
MEISTPKLDSIAPKIQIAIPTSAANFSNIPPGRNYSFE